MRLTFSNIPFLLHSLARNKTFSTPCYFSSTTLLLLPLSREPQLQVLFLISLSCLYEEETLISILLLLLGIAYPQSRNNRTSRRWRKKKTSSPGSIDADRSGALRQQKVDHAAASPGSSHRFSS
ncbi:hypothetical protein M6B38_321215 [Iris pallida]|uniref:Uncharacterized protein n=1 Tax=Iris pallida TaxID=29817 RepID=A0AAX6HBA6_IRIPA|nr:hypothetical protein M6B38_321215 [Iris pallida]